MGQVAEGMGLISNLLYPRGLFRTSRTHGLRMTAKNIGANLFH